MNIDKQIDGIDIIDGKKSAEKTCFERIVEAMAAIGVGQNLRYKLAVKVLGKKTRNSEGLNFTLGLNKAALEAIGGYAIRIIENTIEQGLVEIPGP